MISLREAAVALLKDYDQAKRDTVAVLRMSRSISSVAELMALDFEPPTITALRSALSQPSDEWRGTIGRTPAFPGPNGECDACGEPLEDGHRHPPEPTDD